MVEVAGSWVDLSGGGSEHGYVRLLGLEPAGTAELVEKVERGFAFDEFEHLRENWGLTTGEISELVQINPRTLARRKKQGRLRPDESDRLLRLSRVFGRVLVLFEGDVESAREWLSSPQPALGGALPLALARTEVGAREVEDVAGRLEHGVFS